MSSWGAIKDADVQNPDRAWSKLQVKRDVLPVATPAADDPVRPGHVRLVCISDTHNRIDENTMIPPGDILIHSGDFTNVGEPRDIDKFVRFLRAQPHRHKVVIAGNHDLSLDETSYARTRLTIAGGRPAKPIPTDELRRQLSECCTYLEDSGATIEGLKFWGSPWSPTFCDWAFNADRGEVIDKIWQQIPADTDVLITHGPPIGHGDLCMHGGRAGCVDLLRHIETRVQPAVHISGHIHEGHGATKSTGDTIFINASTCNISYRPDNPPILLDLPSPTKQ